MDPSDASLSVQSETIGMQLQLPHLYAIDESLRSNPIKQILLSGQSGQVTSCVHAPHTASDIVIKLDGEDNPILLTTGDAAPSDEFTHVIRVPSTIGIVSLDEAKWLRHPSRAQLSPSDSDYRERVQQAIDSWREGFHYIKSEPPNDEQGLRTPQLGAIHAIHAHWTKSADPATIVMPTGTGKTETMLAILVSERCSRLLVVVPTEALRSQLAAKFLTLGFLKRLKVLNESALYPVVGILKHRPQTVEEINDFFERCNVIVSTAQVVALCEEVLQHQMATCCPYLFFDEAHHVEAPTWHKFKQQFVGAKIVQFTATPFRNDGKPIGGRIIYEFPLSKALEQEYFKPIQFKPVIVFDKQAADEAIAAKAVAQLRDDLQNHDHILMARVSSIQRAREVYEIYARYTEFTTVQIHTGITSDAERNRIRKMILGRQARIVVCVDMLGEGFDLPELKIAAFHDIRKSLAVTIQLIGRFTRAKNNLGDATCIANIGDVEVRDELRKLYMQGADWSQLLIQSSEMIIGEQLSLQDFLDGFGSTPEEISLQSMRPALSTVIYRTKSKLWKPENLQAKLSKDPTFEQIYTTVNEAEKTLIVVTAKRVAVDWAQLKDVFSWDWELLVIHWDEEQNLLFIHGSGNEGYYKEIAQAVVGDAELITGLPVFRVFSGVNRLRLQNVGLAEQLGRLIRYTMRAGSDVETGLTSAQKRNARKSNIFGTGYEYGGKTSVGCSYRGRIWAQRRGNVSSLVKWFRRVGAKVIDERIDPDQVLSGTLTPRPVAARPNVMPIGIEWPEVFYTEPETTYEFVIDGTVVVPLYLAELSLTDPSKEGDITFKLETLERSVTFTSMIRQQDEVIDYSYAVETGRSVALRRRGIDTLLTEFFYTNPPVIWFADGASLEGNSLTELKRTQAPYPVEKVQVWDWTGTDIHKESQGANKESGSIQYRVIAELKKGNYQVIVDDDDSGEAADVVAVRVEEKTIVLELYHCKYSHGKTAGHRIEDLYEVCGQAQRSIHWVEKPTELLNHLLRRDENRIKQGKVSRIEVGTPADIMNMREGTRMMQVRFAIYIVQPGLSKAQASLSQLELLSVTENYLGETYQIPFGVIAHK